MQYLISIILLFNIMALHAQKQATNQHFWHTVETTAPPERIWKIWTDVSNWKAWDTGLKDAQLEGVFKLNAKGFIISLEGRKAKFKVTEYIENQSYTYKTALPLGGLYVKRYLSAENGKTTFSHEVWFEGLTKKIFAKILGSDFQKMLPEVLQNIKNLAENARS
ncbi:MAG: SRPBCC family protein [Bacteroidota bacterium]